MAGSWRPWLSAALASGGVERQLLEQDVEAANQELAGFRQIPQQFGHTGTHFLQRDIGGSQGATLFQDIPRRVADGRMLGSPAITAYPT